MKKVLFIVVIVIGFSLELQAADWPMWRHNAGHTAASPEQLNEKMYLQWQRQLEAPRRAWTDKSNANIYFDLSYEPVVASKIMYVGSMNNDSITAYDTESGREIWRYFADGPVRFAPVVYKSKVYAASDDGFLYCLDAKNGELVWRFRAVPRNDKILGNERLISRWPVRGAPVIYDHTLYFAASIWAFEGTFIYALDPQTGKEIWCNSGSGTDWMLQQHYTPAFAGVCPQGYLAASDKVLLVPSGRAVPGGYDRKTGKFLYWHGSNRKIVGNSIRGYDVSISGNRFINRGGLYQLDSGKVISKVPEGVNWQGDIYHINKGKFQVLSLDKKNTIAKTPLRVPRDTRVFAKAGNYLLCGDNKGTVTMLSVAGKKTNKIVFKASVDGAVWTILVADQKVFVVTETGGIFCFGREKKTPITHKLNTSQPIVKSNRVSDSIKAALKNKSSKGGYALVLGADADQTIDAIVDHTGMHVIVVDENKMAIDALRKRLAKQGIYGSRVSAVAADPFAAGLPPYIAELIVVSKATKIDSRSLTVLYNCLRPYGGVALMPGRNAYIKILAQRAKLASAEIGRQGDLISITRTGPLKGSALWTHQYADAGNSVTSRDDLVKPPFGLLWFGGPPNDNILPRHGHGPSPQVAGGRIFIEGENIFRCLDVYTGRLLWGRQIEGVGYYYRHTGHHPGANEIGSNYVSLPDAVYLTLPDKCLKLDPATGKTLLEFSIPEHSDGKHANWGFINASGDYLVAAATPVTVEVTYPPLPSVSEATFVSEKITPKDKASGGIAIDVDVRGAKQLLLVLEPVDKNVSDCCAWIQPRLIGPKGEQKLTEIPWAWGWSRSPREKPRVGLNDRNRALTVHGKHIKDGIGVHAKSAFMYNLPVGFDRFKCRVSIDDVSSNSNKGVKAIVYVIKEPKTVLPKTFAQVKGVVVNDLYGPSSKDIYVFNRLTGDVVWHKQANYNFRHNAIVISKDKLFCIDAITVAKHAYLNRRGLVIKENPALTAYDLATGEIVWRTEKDVFGTWLGYSAEHDVLLQAGSRNRDRSWDDVGKGVSVLRAADGNLVWKDLNLDYGGPLILYHDQFISNGSTGRGFSLLTGKPLGWSWSRKYGCNTATASEHLLLFRSSTASYYDLKNKGGTINFGGFKSGCTSNMMPADGVLSIPDYTRTCTCSYQNQTSLGLVHRPESETWAMQGKPTDGRVGINLGAEGDRLAADGTYWVEYPLSGSGQLKINVDEGDYFQHHSLLYNKHPKAWITASGLQGAKQIDIPLKKGRYTVRLYFAEPDKQAVSGTRVFDVIINGKTVLSEFDPYVYAQSPRNTIIKSWDGIEVDSTLKVTLKARTGKTLLCGIEAILSK